MTLRYFCRRMGAAPSILNVRWASRGGFALGGLLPTMIFIGAGSFADDRPPKGRPHATTQQGSSNAKRTPQPKNSWKIRFSSLDRTSVFQQDGSGRTVDLVNQRRRAYREVSPDGSQIVYAENRDKNLDIYVADAQGKHRKRLTNDEAYDTFPRWSPDGRRIAFMSNRNGKWQVCVIDRNGDNVKQITDDPLGAMYPRYSRDGCLAFHVVRGARGKLKPVDLVVTRNGKDRQTVVAGVYVGDFAWSPNGEWITYSKYGSLVFQNLKTKQQREIAFKDIDRRLSSHSARFLSWRPDNRAVACSIAFLGGRAARVGGAPNIIFGDEELFVLPLEGNPSWFRVGGEMTNPDFTQPIDWVRE